jgi:hypothetical protein
MTMRLPISTFARQSIPSGVAADQLMMLSAGAPGLQQLVAPA